MEPQLILYYRVRSPCKSSKIKNWKNQGIISDNWDNEMPTIDEID